MLPELDLEDETFVVYIAFLMRLIYCNWETLIVGLEVEEIIVLTEYLDFAKVFSFDSEAELSEHFKINNYPIGLEKSKQLS